jgi:hypothetical protein
MKTERSTIATRARCLLATGLLGLVALAQTAQGKAYFAPKAEMIRNADAIVVVNITAVEKVEKKTEGWTYAQKATGIVERCLKGGLSGGIEIFGLESFICAQCRYTAGRHLLFLRKEGGMWVGANWEPGIRPIDGNNVSWFAKDDDPFESRSMPLADVLAEIEAHVKTNAVPKVPTIGKP